MLNRPNFLNATVHFAEELYVIEVQYMWEVRRKDDFHHTISHWQELPYEFGDYDEALEELMAEKANDESIVGARIRQKMRQSIEWLKFEWDRDDDD